MTDSSPRITSDPTVCGGRPCIRGLRIRVVDILSTLATSMSSQQVLNEYPDLEPEDISAALQFAADWMDHAMLRAS